MTASLSTPPAPFDLLSALAEVAGRPAAARALARRLGADELLLLVRDPELGVLLPAPGFPQTMRGGPTWRTFLATCDVPGQHRGSVQRRDGEPPVPVLGHVGPDGVTLVLIGGAPDLAEVEALLPALPLLGALLRAETAARIAEGAAAAARDAGRQARDLTRALDTTRSDLEGALRESARLNHELQDADRRKDEFLAMLGHELRNPMAAITSALELMRVSPDSLEVLGRARAVIERQSQQLGHLIDDLLDVARVTRGKIVLRSVPVDLNEVVRRAVETTHSLVMSRKHRLDAQYAAPLLVLGDPTRLEQIATNLLSNAAKYTDECGKITVAVAREGDEAVLRVQDSG
ncbi:MAG TPA: HAMP domain-containing sensor histidine kinase, partial [Nannocystis sp.]